MDLTARRPTPGSRAHGGLAARLSDAGEAARKGLAFLTPLLDFGIRLFVASVFFKAGLTKIASWSTTLTLFEYEYAVPLLPPELAAWLATAAELTLPVLLVLGLGTRLSALALFVFNAVAVISWVTTRVTPHPASQAECRPSPPATTTTTSSAHCTTGTRAPGSSASTQAGQFRLP